MCEIKCQKKTFCSWQSGCSIWRAKKRHFPSTWKLFTSLAIFHQWIRIIRSSKALHSNDEWRSSDNQHWLHSEANIRWIRSA